MKKINSIRQVELAYIAGILDGEGCIRSQKYIQREKETFGLSVCIVNSNLEMLLYVQNSLEMGKIRKKKRLPGHNFQVYEWYCSQGEIVSFLEAVLPYLHVKDRQAKLAIQFRSRAERGLGYIPSKNRYYQKTTMFGKTLSVEERRIRKNIYTEMRGLNSDNHSHWKTWKG